jgi:DNA-binding NarL/FixJ family response regulator
MTITTLVVEDNFLVREGVLRMLARVEGVVVVAACSTLDEALSAIEEHHPDLVLSDIRMPPTGTDEGLQIAEYCRRRHPGTGVVLLSQYVEVSYVRGLLARGTERRGYLLKERISDLGDLEQAIRAVAGGGSSFDPKVIEALVTVRSRADGSDLHRLTPRELEVLEGIAQGRTNARVAADLVLTQKAVEKHINSIFAKLGLTGDQSTHPRVRAALLYLAEGRS